MTQQFVFLMLGLANGAVYAALGLTLVVTYRSSGVVNFGTGAMAMFGAYTYAFLREGKLLLPLPFVPKTVGIGANLGFWPAAIISIVASAAVGLLVYLALFRPLRAAPPVAKAVASVGLIVVLTGLFQVRVGTDPVFVQSILPTSSWTVGGVHISSDRVWFAVIVVAIAVALAGVYRFTRFGLLTRAVAETEKGAYVSGIRPDRIAAANWMISGAVGAVSGILIAPIVPLTPIGYTLFIVPALAAATLGRFTALLPAVLGGLAIGMLQSDSTYLQGKYTWLPSSGLPELVPLVLILLVLVVRGRPLPSRGADITQRLGRAPRPSSLVSPTLAWTTVAVVALFALQGTWRAAFIMSLIMAVIALSLVVVTGYAGQISLAQLTLAGVAGFTLGPMTTHWHIPFPIAPLLAAAVAAVVGVVVGLPALRIRGLPVAVVTLALGVAIEALWFVNSDFVGNNGKNIAGPSFLGVNLRARTGTDYPRPQFGLLVIFVLVCVAVGVAKLRTSRLGSAMLALRANERSAAGAGVNVVFIKLIAFGIAAFIAGIGGSLLGYFQSNVTDDSFTMLTGLALFNIAYVAGVTSVSGGILAGMIATGGLVALIGNSVFHLGTWYSVIAGISLLVTIIKNPEGMVGPAHTWLARRRLSGRPTSPSHLPDAPLSALEPATGGEVLLSVHDLTVRYGGVIAVNNVDLEVRRGTIVGLIGPNGAGKTTFVDALTGFAPYTGEVVLNGRDLKGLSPHQRVRAALGRTFQLTQLYEDLSVTENVLVGTAAAQGQKPRDLHDTLELLDLTSVADQPVGALSQGRRQLVAIARALIGNPQILLLDEPAGGLDTNESQWLGQRLRLIRDSGITILLIDHDMHLVLNVCDAVHVLDFGSTIASGAPAQIKSDPAVTDAYLGTTHADVVTP